jgi:hypothetical protein
MAVNEFMSVLSKNPEKQTKMEKLVKETVSEQDTFWV